MAGSGRFLVAVAFFLAPALAFWACSSEDAAERAREAAERIQAEMADPQAAALGQEVAPETVKEAQQHLTAVGEYMGEVNGKLDPVTVNAVEAFQVARGLDPNGLLTEKTMRRLRQAAKEATK